MVDVGRSNGFSGTETTYFSRFAADMDLDWHPASRRQFIITLSGTGYEIETSDGAVAQPPPGSVLLVEDTNPLPSRSSVSSVPKAPPAVSVASDDP